MKCSKCIYQNTSSIQCDQCVNFFHIRCTKITLKMLKKESANNKNYTFVCDFCKFSKCSQCNLPVFNNQNSIKCDYSECFLKYHLKCTNVSIKTFNLLKETGDPWICKNCYTFPFMSIDKNSFISMNNDKMENSIRKFVSNNPNFFPKCNICSKNIRKSKIQKCIPCKSCSKLIHRKCSGIPLNELPHMKYKDILYWECNVCMNDKFPFTNSDNTTIIKLLNFNSNFNCPCQTKIQSVHIPRNYNFKLDKYSVDNDKNYFGPDAYDQTGQYTDLKPSFDYYQNHDFHKLIKNNASKK